MSDDPDPADDDGGMPLPEESYRRAHGWTGDNFEVPPKPNGEDRTLDAWVEPVDFELIRTMRARELGPQHIPPSLWVFVDDTSQRLGVATSSVALACLVALSAVIREEWQLQPKRKDWSWKVEARLWGAIVGPPSIRKSPIVRAATAPIIKLEAAARDAFGRAVVQFKADLKAWKKAFKDDPETAGEEPRPPLRGRFMVESATIEALQEVLRDDGDAKFITPTGRVLILQDELGEFLGNMDKYTTGTKGSGDRHSYCRLYDGGQHPIDRIGRGSFLVKSWSACLLGGIQPDVIQRIANETVDDGLLQRFMYDVPPPQTRERVDREPNYPAMKAYEELFAALTALRPERTGYEGEKHNQVVTLHEGAHAHREAIDGVIETLETMAASGRVGSTVGKWGGLFGRLCLVFHLIELAAHNVRHPDERTRPLGPLPSLVSEETAARVHRYMDEILAPNLLRADGVIFHSPETNHAGWIAGYILAKRLDVVHARNIVQDYHPIRAPELKRSLHSIMESLVLFGWVVPIEPSNPSKPPHSWMVNPRVHIRFARRAVEEKTRRERAYQAMLDRMAANPAEPEC